MPRPGDPPVDPRGVRFSAAVTTVVLALVLLSGSAWLLAAQAVVFALGAFAGLRFSPYSVLYRALVAASREAWTRTFPLKEKRQHGTTALIEP